MSTSVRIFVGLPLLAADPHATMVDAVASRTHGGTAERFRFALIDEVGKATKATLAIV
jgi:hypothetical protein